MRDNNDPPGIRRRLPIEDAPKSIIDVAGSHANQIQVWPNQHIVDTIQKLKDAGQGDDNVQILLNMLGECEFKLTTVESQGNEELHRCGDGLDENDRGRWRRQRYEFCKRSREGVRNLMAERIQVPGSYVHQDVLTRLNTGCESSRRGLESNLNWANNIQCRIVQGAQQFSHDVDNKLTQNDQRNDTQEGMIKELYTAMQNYGVQIGRNRQENILTHLKFTSVGGGTGSYR